MSNGNSGTKIVPSPPYKLIIMIVSNTDANRLLRRLIECGYPATQIGSTGGFLRTGNATILSGVEADAVEPVLALVRAECQARTEYVPVQTLPFVSDGTLLNDPLEVRVGGATVFVLSMERFEKI